MKSGDRVQTRLGDGMYLGRTETTDTANYWGMVEGAKKIWDVVQLDDGIIANFPINEISLMAKPTRNKLSDYLPR